MAGVGIAYQLMGIQNELRARDTARATQNAINAAYPYLGQAYPSTACSQKAALGPTINIVSEIERDYNKMMEGWDK